MIYAVIDTNVWVSALLTHNDSSPTERIFRLLFKGEIVALYNDEIMAEYEDVLSRKRFRFLPWWPKMLQNMENNSPKNGRFRAGG